jgi:hypothetical protein
MSIKNPSWRTYEMHMFMVSVGGYHAYKIIIQFFHPCKVHNRAYQVHIGLNNITEEGSSSFRRVTTASKIEIILIFTWLIY